MSEDNKGNYPKILIIGQSFNLRAGGGITKANLFKGWPLDKIAVATEAIDSTGLAYCRQYYRLGYDETRRPWPFNLIQPKYKSEPVIFNEVTTDGSGKKHSLKKSRYPLQVKKILHSILHFFGLFTFIFRIKVSQKFLTWLKEYNPDIIYTGLAKLEYNNFIFNLVKIVDIPLVIHIMDDWPKTIDQPSIFYPIFKKITDKRFRYLINKAAINMGICQAMNEEYKYRYGRSFVPFHNTVDWAQWKAVAKKDYTYSNTFKILYAGRIGRGTSKSIFTIIEALKLLTDNGLKIEFQIQTKDLSGKIKDRLSKFNFIRINDFLPYDQLPGKFASVDLLILPMDFSKWSLRFIHLSMPTKVPEYMASGTPIFVFAHSSTALYKYAYRSRWAYTLSKNNIGKISDAINELYTNQSLRESLGRGALHIVQNNHDGNKVREQFRQTLNSCINNN